MKTRQSACFRRPAIGRAVTAALATLAASSALADPLLTVKLFRDADVMFRDSDMSRYAENYVEIGAGYNSNDSYRFGQFSGLYEKGAFGILNVNWKQRNEANDARYWSVFGSNLGLESRRFRFEAGEQGRWDAYLGVDQLTKSEAENVRFTHGGLGTNTLTQLCGDVANASSVTPGCLQAFGIQQQRDIYRFGLRGAVADGWDAKVDYREDRRDGTRLTGFYFSSAVIVPYATNDKTQQVETLVSYTDKRFQWQLGYQYSKFSNTDPYIQAENPFTTAAGNAIGRLSLNPDNDFHQLHTTAAFNLSPQTRLTGQLSYGLARQNQAFLPYTTATGGSVTPANVSPAIPSLDGEIAFTNADVALLTRPLDKMSLKLAYQFVNKDNRTPINTYTYFSRDNNAAPGATNTRTNVPLSSKEHRFLADADYEVASRTYLRGQLERRNVKYERADRTETNTDRASLELRRPVSDEFLGAVGYIFTQRTGSDYNKNVFFENSYSAGVQTSSGFTNHPSMRQFLWNDYRENRVRATGNWTATETVSLQAVLDGYHQRSSRDQNCSSLSTTQDNNTSTQIAGVVQALPDTCLGRDLAAGGSVNFDLQWQPEENFTTFAFVNYALTETDLHGRWYGGGAADTVAPATKAANDWFANTTMRDRAAGLGFKWQPVETWDLGGTYVFANSHGAIGALRASGTQPTAIPDTRSRLHTVQLFAKWDATKTMTWRLNYLYEMLRSEDYMLDNAVAAPGAGTNTNVLYIGQTSPKYINHVVGVSVAIKNW